MKQDAPRRMDSKRATTYSAIIIAAAVIAFTLREMQSVMVPFVIALFLYYMFVPITDALRRRLKVPHVAAVALSLLGAILVLFLITMTAARSIQTLAQNWEKYEKNVDTAIEKIGELTGSDATTLSDAWGEVTEAGSVQAWATSVATSLPAVLANAAIVFVFFGYLISGRKRSSSPFLRKVSLTINRYLVIKFTVSLITGLTVWLLLALIGLELAFIFGFCAFALNFVPSVGSMIATLLPIPVAIAQFEITSAQMILVIVLPGAVQFIVGNVIEPTVQGEGLDLHPITVLLALMFWFTIWGVPGALIAAPLTSVIRIFLRQTDWGKGAANLLSGRI